LPTSQLTRPIVHQAPAGTTSTRGGWLTRLLGNRRPAYRKVRPHQARRLIAEGAAVVDVREPAQWRAGHIKGSVNIPLAGVLARRGEIPQGRVVTVCRSGPRSARAAELLAAHGYEAFNLRGGLREWDYAGYPLADVAGEPGFVA
jgi:rhodanese-related sulfurtransferase